MAQRVNTLRPEARSVSVVVPALNEAENIASVVESIPVAALESLGWTVEIMVVDNASTDGTGEVARRCGARVVHQPIGGYGSAYKAGFANSTGSVIATGDADLTYPFEMLPLLLGMVEDDGYDFISTNRLARLDPAAMTPSHVFGNRVLSGMARALFLTPFQDSQSGMWVFRRSAWDHMHVRSNGMAFSQELKHEAFARGFRCAEVEIAYRPRGGEKKLRTVRDGAINASQLLGHRIRLIRDSEVAPAFCSVAGPVSMPLPARIDLDALALETVSAS